MSALREIMVHNKGKAAVERVGFVFNPGEVVTVKCSKYHAAEIFGHKDLYPFMPIAEAKEPAQRTQVGGNEELDSHACPFCDAETGTKRGLLSHVRIKHPEFYEDFKAGE